MTDEQKLAEWLKNPSFPSGLSSEVEETILIMRPDLAPVPRVKFDDIWSSREQVLSQQEDSQQVEQIFSTQSAAPPRVSIDDILGEVRDGPLAKGSEATHAIGHEPENEAPDNVIFLSKWLKSPAFLGAMAAAMALIVLLPTQLNAPIPPSAEPSYFMEDEGGYSHNTTTASKSKEIEQLQAGRVFEDEREAVEKEIEAEMKPFTAKPQAAPSGLGEPPQQGAGNSMGIMDGVGLAKEETAAPTPASSAAPPPSPSVSAPTPAPASSAAPPPSPSVSASTPDDFLSQSSGLESEPSDMDGADFLDASSNEYPMEESALSGNGQGMSQDEDFDLLDNEKMPGVISEFLPKRKKDVQRSESAADLSQDDAALEMGSDSESKDVALESLRNEARCPIYPAYGDNLPSEVSSALAETGTARLEQFHHLMQSATGDELILLSVLVFPYESVSVGIRQIEDALRVVGTTNAARCGGIFFLGEHYWALNDWAQAEVYYRRALAL